MSLIYKYNLGSRARLGFILRRLRKIRKKTGREISILDIGCGTGYLSNEMSRYGNVTGIDPEKDSITLAKKIYRHKFAVGSGLDIPFGDSIFDVVVTTEVIEHVPDDIKFLSEIRRVLKNRGLLILTTECREGIFPVDESCHEEGTKYYINYTSGYTKKDLLKKLRKSGFRVFETEYSLAFFSKIIMEITKKVYRKINPSHNKQSDIENVSESIFFRIYKLFFPVLLAFNLADYLLSKIIKGSCIMTFSRLKK